MKHEWRKHEKTLYLPKTTPEKIQVAPYKFYSLAGCGNPNNEHFSEETAALFAMAYGIKMLPKKGPAPAGYFDYTVYPLEGLWTLKDGAKLNPDGTFNKEDLQYKIMIRQPDFVTPEIAAANLAAVSAKKPNPNNSKITFETLTDGLAVQLLHVGPYDSEPASFERIATFIKENGLQRLGYQHREIYLSDARKTAPEKLKTVLRCFVKEI